MINEYISKNLLCQKIIFLYSISWLIGILVHCISWLFLWNLETHKLTCY